MILFADLDCACSGITKHQFNSDASLPIAFVETITQPHQALTAVGHVSCMRTVASVARLLLDFKQANGVC